MTPLSEYLLEKSKEFDPEKAGSALEIEKAMNRGDFVVTSDMEFTCKKLDDIQAEDLEEAIKQYWDDAGIDWLKVERKGNTFKISTKTHK